MRETYTTLQTAAQGYVANDTSATTLTFLQNEINRAKTFVYSDMRDYITERFQTTLSVLGQQFYHTPVDFKDVVSITYTIGGVIYTLDPVDSPEAWNGLNAVTFTGTAIPRYYYERKRDFGIWPIPQEANDVITLQYNILDRNMIYADVTNTVTFTNNSQTITGSGTAWDQTFVGRWILGNDQFWYRIIAVASTTSATLETFYAGNNASSVSTTIGDSPDLPEETHPLLSMRAAQMYYAGFRKDWKAATYYSNLFYTGSPEISATQVLEGAIEPPGGYLAIKNNYATRSTNMVIHHARNTDALLNDLIWGTHVSSI